jgi:hypothetical protein
MTHRAFEHEGHNPHNMSAKLTEPKVPQLYYRICAYVSEEGHHFASKNL